MNKTIDVKNISKGTASTETVAAMLYLLSEEANKVSGREYPCTKKRALG